MPGRVPEGGAPRPVGVSTHEGQPLSCRDGLSRCDRPRARVRCCRPVPRKPVDHARPVGLDRCPGVRAVAGAAVPGWRHPATSAEGGDARPRGLDGGVGRLLRHDLQPLGDPPVVAPPIRFRDGRADERLVQPDVCPRRLDHRAAVRAVGSAVARPSVVGERGARGGGSVPGAPCPLGRGPAHATRPGVDGRGRGGDHRGGDLRRRRLGVEARYADLSVSSAVGAVGSI